MSGSTAYISLFLAAFLAATIIPAQSEAGLSALILTTGNNVVLLVVAATFGNVLGAVVNWYLGRWSLLLSWLPFIGDPITIAAGVLREPLLSFGLIVGFAKAARYILVAAITLNLI